ncbi:unnamed protein product [Rotaria sordida]|uniref:Uncharacterized protein n=1 Tax=Rotaria sordida TaxID=392033 RepID=A0A814QFU2_9BILA|nr:unnamed protein product [Rotaria sordida]CAF1119418.1 unnamed protein product [Rotaria sordida]CAF3595573.1 unnamed protein product [Rotaria sordida]CAF4019213.1 unnamed protein product [Rotaria sordida]
MTTSKINSNPTIISKIETTSNHNPYNRDVQQQQQRINSSKRTTTTAAMINNIDQLIDNNVTVLHQSKTHHSSRLTKQKDKCENSNISSLSKLENTNEEIYTTPLNNEDIRISSSIKQKQQSRQEIGDYIRKDSNNEDADEESTTVCGIRRKNKTPNEHIHPLSIPSNNSAIHIQQQGMGDHYHTSTRQHKSRNKTTGLLNRRYHRLIEQQDHEISLNERHAYRWRIFMYIIIIIILIFVIYRFLLAIWPKRKKTFMEQFIDELFTFFTP